MSTVTAVPAPPRPVEQAPSTRRTAFERRMRGVLRDDAGWAELVADPRDRNDAEQWLKTTSTSIDQQLAFRHDEVELWSLRPEDPKNRSRLAEHHEWRKGALYMKSLCEQRIIALNRMQALDESRADAVLALLLQLGRAVHQHKQDLDIRRLHAVLDRIVLPGEGGLTLRELLESQDRPGD